MDALTILGKTYAMYLIIFILSYVLAWLFTEVIRHPLQFKPFNCRPCASFWLTLGGTAAYTWLMVPDFVADGVFPAKAMLYTTCLLLGFINYLSVKPKKYKIYD